MQTTAVPLLQAQMLVFLSLLKEEMVDMDLVALAAVRAVLVMAEPAQLEVLVAPEGVLLVMEGVVLLGKSGLIVLILVVLAVVVEEREIPGL